MAMSVLYNTATTDSGRENLHHYTNIPKTNSTEEELLTYFISYVFCIYLVTA